MAPTTSTAEKVGVHELPARKRTGGLILATPLEDAWLLSIACHTVWLDAPWWITACTLGLFLYHLLMAALDVDFDNHPAWWPVAVYPRVPMWALHVPSYIIAVACLLPTAFLQEAVKGLGLSPSATWWLHGAGWLLVVVYRLALAGLVAGAVWVNRHLPMTVLPTPAGPYRVATHVTFMNMDVEGDQRRCRVRTCFPADVQQEDAPAHPYSYWPSTATIRMLLGMNPNSTKYFPAERFLFHVHTHGVLFAAGQATRVSAAALQEASLSGNGRLPILLFSHGLVGCPESDTVLNTQLASWGFICMEIEHHDGSAPYTITPWDGDRTVTLSMPTDELRDTNPPMYHAKAGEHLLQRLSELGLLLEVLAAWQAEAEGRGDGPVGLVGKDLALLRELLVQHADFGMVFAAGHSAGAGAVFALAALEASGRTVPPSALDTPVAGWMKEVFPDLAGTINDTDPGVVYAQAKAALDKAWPPAAPRVKLQGTVSLDPWINSLPFDWAHKGLCGARVMVVLSSLYGGAEDMARDKDHYHRRDAMLLRQMVHVKSRVTAWRASAGLSPLSPHVARTLSTRGLRNGVDQHGKPLFQLPHTQEEVDTLPPSDEHGSVLGVHPMTIAVRNTHYEHLNFNDVAVVMTSVARLLDYLGASRGVEPSLGSVPDMQGLLHLADVIRVGLVQFAKDVNWQAGNASGVQFTPAERTAREAAGHTAAPVQAAASPTWTAIRELQAAAGIDERCKFHVWAEDEMEQWWADMAAYDAAHGGDVFEQYLADVKAGKSHGPRSSMPT